MEPSEEEKITYHLVVSPEFEEDLSQFDRVFRLRIDKAIRYRLAAHPTAYGKPLTKLLSDYWRLRVGDYRLVYKIVGSEIRIVGILHRKNVYERILNRLF